MHPNLKTLSALVFLMLAPQSGILNAGTIEKRLADLSRDATSPKRAAYATFEMAEAIDSFGAPQYSVILYAEAIELARSRPDSKKRDEVLQQAEQQLARVIKWLVENLVSEKPILIGEFRLGRKIPFFATPFAKVPTRHRESPKLQIGESPDLVRGLLFASIQRRDGPLPGFLIIDIVNGRCKINSPEVYWVNLSDVDLTTVSRRPQSEQEVLDRGNYYQELASKYAPALSGIVRNKRMSAAYSFAVMSKEGRYKALQRLRESFPEADAQLNLAPHLDDALFYDAQQKGTIVGYEEYLKEYPNGSHEQEVQSALEETRFDQARRTDTIESYSTYISLHPDGAHIGIARTRLEELYFRRVQSTNKRSDYTEFLRRYPVSRFRQDALSAIEDLDYKNAQSQDSVPAYEEFLSRHPAGQRTLVAQKAMSRLKANAAFLEARNADTQASYEGFLQEFPDAEQANDAWAKIYLTKAITDQTLSSFRSFFDYYGRMSFHTVSQTEWEAARNLLAALALKRQDFAGFLLLYDECKAYRALDEAAKLVRTVAQEEEIARREPARFFKTEGGSINNDKSVAYISFLSHITMNTDTSVTLPFRSVARYGTYRVKLKLTIRIEFREETVVLLVGKRVVSKTENSSATAEVLLRPNGDNDYAVFNFPSFTSHDETGLKILAKVTKDLVSVQAERIDFETVNLSH